MAMDAQRMTEGSFIVAIGAFMGLGALSGFIYLSLLAWSVRALTKRSRGLVAAAASSARTVPMVAAFSFSVAHGAAALIAAFAGFMASRAILLRSWGIFAP
jgi:hypothetical protein